MKMKIFVPVAVALLAAYFWGVKVGRLAEAQSDRAHMRNVVGAALERAYLAEARTRELEETARAIGSQYNELAREYEAFRGKAEVRR